MSGDENPFGELLQDYVLECLPLAEQVADAFVELERRWRADDPADDVLASLPGRLHTVKGNSAMMGLAPMRDVAHALEDACGLLRQQPERRNDAAAALLVAGGGLLADLVRQASPELDPGARRPVRRAGAPMAGARARLRLVGHAARAAPVGSARRRSAAAGAEKAASVVRVDFRRLDAMLEVLGEGLIQHSALAEAYRELARRSGASEELDRLDQAVVALQKTLKRLESTLMETRLLPISTVFGRFPRMVRDTAEAEGKRVRLVQAGGETPLDKAVLDRLSEPLRAPGHQRDRARHRVGGRPPPGRASPRKGTVRLEAAPQAGRVVIRVSRRRPRPRRAGDPEEGGGAGPGRARRREHPAPQPDLPARALDGRAGLHAGGPRRRARRGGRRDPRAGRHDRRRDRASGKGRRSR